MRPEPWIEESNYQRRLEAEHKLYLRGCPWCNVCDEQIDDMKCYILDDSNPFETCVHEKCMEKQFDNMKKNGVNVFVQETIMEDFDYHHHGVTPHKEYFGEDDEDVISRFEGR